MTTDFVFTGPGDAKKDIQKDPKLRSSKKGTDDKRPSMLRKQM